MRECDANDMQKERVSEVYVGYRVKWMYMISVAYPKYVEDMMKEKKVFIIM